MKAMILSAGRGRRMRHLTNTTPKSLLQVQNKPLIFYHLEKLAAAGVSDVVINLAYLGEQIQEAVGNGQDFGLQVHYSQEPEGGLETGGGILQALPILGHEPFIVISADIWTAFSFADLSPNMTHLAHLILVQNPPYHPQGDFNLTDRQLYTNSDDIAHEYTYASIGVYHSDLFQHCQTDYFRLGPLLKAASCDGAVTGEIYTGCWENVGTPEQLAKLNQ